MDIKVERRKFSQINCICCGTIIESNGNSIKDSAPQQRMWDSGLVDKVSAGYGSDFDGDFFYMGICDICIKEKLLDGSIFYGGDYISPSVDKMELDYDNIRRERIRDNNLNKILKDENKK